MRKAYLIAMLVLSVSTLSGQTVSDSLIVNRPAGNDLFFLPAALLAGSVILYADPVKQEIQRIFPNTRTRVDDWLIYGPVAELYIFDLLGFKHRSPVAVQTGNLLLSQLITSGIVGALKRNINAQRPSGGIRSYPSGHTSAAFVGATLLYHEFRDSEPALAWSGFALATATGFLRITNDAHWLPDVMAGAALGILVTSLVYKINPLKKCRLISGNYDLNCFVENNGSGISLLIVL